MTGILIRSGKFGHWSRRHTGECPVTTEAETEWGLYKPRNAKDCWQPWQLRRKKEGFSPTAFREHEPDLPYHPLFSILSLQLWRVNSTNSYMGSYIANKVSQNLSWHQSPPKLRKFIMVWRTCFPSRLFAPLQLKTFKFHLRVCSVRFVALAGSILWIKFSESSFQPFPFIFLKSHKYTSLGMVI